VRADSISRRDFLEVDVSDLSWALRVVTSASAFRARSKTCEKLK
jgi:hypothetical protein